MPNMRNTLKLLEKFRDQPLIGGVWLCVQIAFFCVAGGSAGANASICSGGTPTYYVSPNGNDGNPGTQGAPFATVNKAASLAQPGTIIQVEPGSYPINTFEIFGGPSGTSAAHITLRGDPNATRGSIVFTGGQWSTGVNNGMQYWDICHITQDGGITTGDVNCVTDGRDSQGIAFVNVANINTDDVEARNNCQAGWRAYGPQGQTGLVNTNINLTNSYIHDNCQEAYQNSAAQYDSGAILQDVVNSTMANNLVENNWGEGINVFGDSIIAYDYPMNNKMLNNVVHNSLDTLIYTSSASGTLISGNFVYQDDPRFNNPPYNGPSEGIKMADEMMVGLGGTGVVTVNNIVYGGWHGFRYGDYGTGRGFINATVVGNTFINSTAQQLYINYTPNNTGVLIANNIISSSTGSAAFVTNTSGLTFSNNLWNGVLSGMQTGAGDIVATPQLPVHIGASYNSATSYIPTISSPVHGAGHAIRGWTSDFFGVTRPNPPSIGAAEPASGP